MLFLLYSKLVEQANLIWRQIKGCDLLSYFQSLEKVSFSEEVLLKHFSRKSEKSRQTQPPQTSLSFLQSDKKVM